MVCRANGTASGPEVKAQDILRTDLSDVVKLSVVVQARPQTDRTGGGVDRVTVSAQPLAEE